MNKSHLVKQWKKTYGEDFKRQYGGVFRKLPFHFTKETLVRLWDKTYGEDFKHEYPQVFKLLGVNEGVEAWKIGDKIKYKATKTGKWRKGKIRKKLSSGKYELDSGKIVYEKDPDAIKENQMKLKEKVVKLADGSYDVKKAKFKLLQRVSKRGLEGIVFLGAGGKLNQWVKGINDLWNKEKIGKGLIEDKMMGLYVINTTGGRTDLVMIFKTKSQLDIGKLAMWRLQFGDATWLSDYVVNYRDQHESVEESIMKLTKSKLKKIIREEMLNEASDIDKSLKYLAKVLKRSGASMKIKGSTIIMDFKGGDALLKGIPNLKFNWPKEVR